MTGASSEGVCKGQGNCQECGHFLGVSIWGRGIQGTPKDTCDNLPCKVLGGLKTRSYSPIIHFPGALSL